MPAATVTLNFDRLLFNQSEKKFLESDNPDYQKQLSAKQKNLLETQQFQAFETATRALLRADKISIKKLFELLHLFDEKISLLRRQTAFFWLLEYWKTQLPERLFNHLTEKLQNFYKSDAFQAKFWALLSPQEDNLFLNARIARHLLQNPTLRQATKSVHFCGWLEQMVAKCEPDTQQHGKQIISLYAPAVTQYVIEQPKIFKENPAAANAVMKTVAHSKIARQELFYPTWWTRVTDYLKSLFTKNYVRHPSVLLKNNKECIKTLISTNPACRQEEYIQTNFPRKKHPDLYQDATMVTSEGTINAAPLGIVNLDEIHEEGDPRIVNMDAIVDPVEPQIVDMAAIGEEPTGIVDMDNIGREEEAPPQIVDLENIAAEETGAPIIVDMDNIGEDSSEQQEEIVEQPEIIDHGIVNLSDINSQNTTFDGESDGDPFASPAQQVSVVTRDTFFGPDGQPVTPIAPPRVLVELPQEENEESSEDEDSNSSPRSGYSSG